MERLDLNAYDRERERDWLLTVSGFGSPEKCVVQPCCLRKDYVDMCRPCQTLVDVARVRRNAAEGMAELAALKCEHGVSVAEFCAECPPPLPGMSPLPGAPVPFVRLRRGDDWGAVYFALDPRDRGGMADWRRGIVTYEGDEVQVRWPTGEVTNESIVMVEHTETISEQGQRDRSVSSLVPCVRSVARGKMGDVTIDTPLDRLEVRESWVNERTRRG